MGGRSSTAASTTTTQDIDTTSVGLQDTSGLGIAAGGDVEFNQEVTDQGAIQGAVGIAESGFDFAGEFGSEALSTIENIAGQAIQTSQAGVATVATGGQSDIAGINSRTIGFVVAGLAAILVLPQLLRRG